MLHVFDALGHHVAPESCGKADHALHDGQIARIVEHVAHEVLVDLEHAGGQALEVHQ